MRLAALTFLFAMMAAVSPTLAETPIRLYAAGSLRAALTEAADVFRVTGGAPIEPVFGASGLLKDRIAGGEAADVFASANMEHPQALAAADGRPVVLFTRNRLCALAQAGLGVNTDNLLDRLLDPAVRVGISTPKADPSGDYALALFRKAGELRPGAAEALDAKAMRLTGGPSSPKPPTDRSVYGLILEERRADIFLTYCTNAVQAARETSELEAVSIPPELAVGADYGLVALGDRPEAARLALFILSPEGQRVLARHGFEAPLLPQDATAP
ncbi:molybdate ABC transporter substrate-binding protein [Azospirillum sp. SYSU D00513]|uniref:molybdate ABC transporter substrate-binding protein n=1 Tax=Azospirillum sp. SYSU D00513 TaxID=2812561 RepID=UPI001A971A17|nr:molybdate ABC transporter substrate-binding protein [Azospirillum sp. SYSU D00513]